MEDSFNESNLFNQLQKLEYWKQLVFGISTCQRLIPNYIFFANEHQLQGASILESCLNKAWNNIFSGTVNSDERHTADFCENVAPNTKDYDSILASSSLDAAIAISLLMKAFTESNTQLIVDIASLARDSVDMYIQDISNLNPNDSDIEQRILHHGLMQTEMKKQRQDIEALSLLSNDLNASIFEVKSKWFNKFESCLDLKIKELD